MRSRRRKILKTMTDTKKTDEVPEGLSNVSHFGLSVLQHNVAIADTKASAATAFSVAFIMLSFQSYAVFSSSGSVIRAALLLPIVPFILAVGCGIRTLSPRYRVASTQAPYFFMSTAFDQHVEAFIDQHMQGATLRVAQREQLRHLHTLAQIARQKYKTLTYTLRFTGAGIATLILVQTVRVLFVQ
jgi:hypothetical protein